MKNNKFKSLLVIIGNINYLTFEKLFILIIGTLIYALVARYLGPDKFGIMNYTISFVALFSIMSTLGIENILIRNIIKDPLNRYVFLGSAFFLKIIGSIIMVITTIITFYIINPKNEPFIIFVIIILTGYIFRSIDVIDFWFKSQLLSKYSAIARIISFIIISIFKIIFIFKKYSLIYFIIVSTVDYIIIAILLVIFYCFFNKNNIFSWKINFKVVIKILNDCWPLIFSGAAVLIYMKIDQVMIGKMIGNEKLGYYSAAVKISESIYFIPLIISTSVFPAILNAKKKSEKLYLTRLQLLYDGFTWISIFIAIVITIISPIIIKILYGIEYKDASKVLSIHVWASIFVFLGVASNKYLITENLTKISLLRTVIGVISNIILNFILIPLIDIAGAALATLISYAISTLFIIIPKKTRISGINILRSFNIIRVIKELINYEKIFKSN